MEPATSHVDYIHKHMMYRNYNLSIATRAINCIFGATILWLVHSTAYYYSEYSKCTSTCILSGAVQAFWPTGYDFWGCMRTCQTEIGPIFGCFLGAVCNGCVVFFLALKGPFYETKSEQRLHLALFIIDIIGMLLNFACAVAVASMTLYRNGYGSAVALAVFAGVALIFIIIDMANRRWDWVESGMIRQPTLMSYHVYSSFAQSTSAMAFKVTHAFVAIIGLLCMSFNQVIGTYSKSASIQSNEISYFYFNDVMALTLPLIIFHLLFLCMGLPEHKLYKGVWELQLSLAVYIINLCVLITEVCLVWIYLYIPFAVSNAIISLALLLWIIDFALHQFGMINSIKPYHGEHSTA